ncbi:hypothetical protein ACIQTZ_07435 [Paenarthrobacter sp. NPDC090520]|uniref:hypothetical protein n=1 Tax=Paenarthrobacter sp. NPDC090520 TaxID=3364382 RepID=UPI0038190227
MTTAPAETARIRKFLGDDIPQYSHGDLIDFLGANPEDGYHSIGYNGLPVDLRVQHRGFDTTIIFFHGAVSPKHSYPVMSGGGVSAAAKANRIFVSDPSLALSGSLNLGWFLGNQQQPELQSVIEESIRHITNAWGKQRLVFFGSSGGGYASLHFASRFPGSLALVANPQTVVANYHASAVERFVKVCFGSGQRISELPAHIVKDVTQTYGKPLATRVAYMQNVNDASHIARHMKPFLRALHPANSLALLPGDWGPGHTPPSKDVFAKAITAVAALPWDEALGSLGFVPPTDCEPFQL